MINGRRALLAASVTFSLVVGSVGSGAADPSDDGPRGGIGGASNAQHLGRGAEAQLAQAGSAEERLASTLTGNAATALTVVNQWRALDGAPALREDGALTVLAQEWADQMAATQTAGARTDLDAVLPGYWYSCIQLYVSRPAVDGVGTFVADLATAPSVDALFYDRDVSHVGVGWAIDVSGNGYLYLLSAEYEFTDVGPSAPFYDEIDLIASWGITTGWADGTFRPLGPVTREAMAAFLYRFWTAGTAIPGCAAGPRVFADVTVGNQFCGAVEWLAAEGITTGWPDGTFRPGQAVTREAMAAFLYRFVNAWNGTNDPMPSCVVGVPRTFTDVSVGHPFCGAIEWLATTGITTGWPDGTFRPGQSIERQAMAAFLVRLDGILP